MTALLIRRYQVADWVSICDIFGRAKPDEMRGLVKREEVVPLDKDELIFRSFNESIIYVAEDAGRIVGYAGHQGSLISFLFVDPNYYRKGIGTTLLKKILAEVGEEAWLLVVKTNIGARMLYRKFGFAIAEEFPAKYNGKDVNVLRLAIKPECSMEKIR